MPKGQPGVSVQASGEIKVERTPTFAGHRGLPVPEPLDPGHAEARRQRRGQGREDRRPGSRPTSASRHEVPITVTPEQRRRHRGRRRAAAEPGRPALRSRRARRSSSARTTSRASRPRAPTASTSSRWATTSGTGCRAASSASTTDRARDGRRRGLRRAGAASSASRLGDCRASHRQHEGAQRRQAPRDRHRHLDRGRLERLPGASSTSGELPQPGRGRHDGPDEGRDRPLHGHDRARGQARRAHARRPRLLLRGPLGLETENLRDGTTTLPANARYNDTSSRRHTEEDADGDPVGTPRYSLMLHDVHESYIPMLYERTGAEAAGRRPAEGPPDRLHRGGARASCRTSR